MSFDRYFRLSSTLLIFTGFFSILITGSYLVPVGIGLAVAALWGFLDERLERLLPIPRSVWNGVAITYVFYLLYDTFFGAQDLVGNSIKFVVYLQVVKLLSPKTNRDRMQIYALSFLHILAATVISSDLSFAAPFLLYVILATWALALFNLRTRQEESSRPERKAVSLHALLHSRDIVTPKFLGLTSLLSLLLLGVTFVIFFTFPRLSMRQFFRQVDLRQDVAGFSDTVELGTIGTIKTNESVVLRVEIPPETDKRLEIESIYWRGSAADQFDGRTWSRTNKERERVGIDIETGVLNIPRAPYPGGSPLQYRVFLEPLSTRLIFGADRLYRVTWEKAFAERFVRGSLRLEMDDYQSYHFQSSENLVSDLTYTGESMVGEADGAELRKEEKEGEYPFWIRSTYLELPRLHPDVEKVFASIPVPQGPVYDRARAIEGFIEKHYRYTLDVQDIGEEDPLRFFLVKKRAGHCEYFSTALTMALRFHGIPARQVMGFRGGEFNPYGNYVAVRQSDAHTWVEVYFPRSGWIPFDPSPRGTAAGKVLSQFRKLNQFFDYLRLRWNKYVVEYDLRTQAFLAEKIGRQIARLVRGQPGESGRELLEKDALTSKRRGPLPPWVGWAVGGAGAAALIWFLRRRQKKRKGRAAEIERLLLGQGYRRSPSETFGQARIAVENRVGRLPELGELVELYYEERFGGRKVPPAQWEPVKRKALEILSSRGREKPPRSGRAKGNRAA